MLKNRNLKIGDKCTYISTVVNGTGSTWCPCIVESILDAHNKVYHIHEQEGDREFIVQDIDEVTEKLKIGDRCEILQWIE